MNANPNFDALVRIAKWAIVGIAVLLVFMSLLAFGSVFFPFFPGSFLEFLIGRYFAAINPLTMKIVSATAIDVWIARALSFTFLFALPPFLLAEWLMRLLRPISLLSRRGRILIVLFFWLVCISMSFLSESVYFSQDGRPQKKYYKDGNGKVEFFPPEMEIHPIYGEQLRFVTPELMKEAELAKLGYSVLTIESSPTNADVYFNWNHRGSTPIKITDQNIQGLLVVTLKGYSPQYKEISSAKNGPLFFNLKPEEIKPSKRSLIVLDQEFQSPDLQSILRSEFSRQKLYTADVEEEQEFRQRLQMVGQKTNQALLAWARAKFTVDLLLFVRAKLHLEELSSVDVGYPDIQKSLKGIHRVQANTETEVVDARTGEILLSFPSQAMSTSIDKGASSNEVLSTVSNQIVRKMKKEVL